MMKFSRNPHVGIKDARDCEYGIEERHWKKLLFQYGIFKITISDNFSSILNILNGVFLSQFLKRRGDIQWSTMRFIMSYDQ